MSSSGNKVLIGFFILSVLLFAMAWLVRNDAAVNSDVDAADRLASTSASGTAHKGPALASYDLEKPARHFKLPKRLREVSGLAMLAANRLLAHDDERGVVVEIDCRDGSIVKKFALGNRRGSGPVADDFEGIAVAEGRIYLVSSAGRLYEFDEGADGETVLYKRYATDIGRDYEIEGLAYDPDKRELLIVSKNPKKNSKSPKLADRIAIYRWSVETKKIVANGLILIPAIEFLLHLGDLGDKRFQPSGIERHPTSGNYFLVAARQCAIAEITPQGKVLAVEKLEANRHPQAEGISFASDNTLILADEGTRKRARLSLYRVTKDR